MGISQSSEAPQARSVHEFVVKDIRGKDLDLSIYKGKVLLIVNIASRCGFGPSNFLQLNRIYDNFKNKDSARFVLLRSSDFEILAFPCNQFLWQAPGASEMTKEIACTRYKTEFPIFQKVNVNGAKTAPVYRFLKASMTGFMGNRIKWNFTKFLIGKDGRVIARYSATSKESVLERDIMKALEEA
ncbi:putative glutathione peroxidase 4 [Nymphaea thermarum]|nr:putative glutathione peroxidase 4 [Nymphaea thermarum]